jgi:hypothetical protein
MSPVFKEKFSTIFKEGLAKLALLVLHVGWIVQLG